MRIRTDGDKAYRKDVIEKAARYYDCNKTDAVVRACDDVPALVEAARTVLCRDDLTAAQRREIAETFNDARGVRFDVETTVEVEKDP